MKNRCIIYGGGGFIGSHLAEELLKNNYEVTVFDKKNFSTINLASFINNINIFEGDFNNENDLNSSLKNIDYVFHLVSSTLPSSSNDNPVYDVQTNLISSLTLFNLLVKKKIKKIVFISSGGTVYGIPKQIPIKEDNSLHPICSYGIIKKTLEDYLFMFNYLFGLDYTVFRLSNPYGEKQNPIHSQGVIPVFLSKALHDEDIVIWGDGEVKRDYIYIQDAVKPLVDSLKYKGKEKVFNLGSGIATSLNELLFIIENILNKKLKIKYIEARKLDVPINQLDINRISEELNFILNTDLETGIKYTIDYLNKLTKN